MSILQEPAQALASGDDAAAIADLKAAFEVQRRAFAADRRPSLDVRRERVGRIAPMMLANRERISAALAQDFGSHPTGAADLIETLAVVGRVQYVLENLEAWTAPQDRPMDAGLFGTAHAYIEMQPKGVVGNMIPWNFPFDIGVGPMVEMLAAGNRVILKPSEYVPGCAALLREMVAEHFSPDLVYVAVGGLDLARAFTELPFDHLLYTGSPGVGRQVMAAAARNLTPVTLELGGKCPAIVLPGAIDAETVKTIVGTKIVKNGQMCVSVDYALVPRGDMDRFADLAQAFMAEAAPDYAAGPDCTGIITARHLDRQEELLQEVRDHQSRIVTLGPDAPADRATRRMPMRLVLDPDPELRIMKEEIFGPILPVVPYDDLQGALDLINGGERPLGLYVFGHDQATVEHVLASTTSGGVSVNACALQGALPSLGFGGVGMSGMGRHHGIEGFREFSNPRGVVVRGEGDQVDAFFAPYAKAEAIVQHVLTGGAAG
ncbi:aldehyde dehydrogenase family protein [Caulobacter sp. S45]|uniref:aldehyde dehydrogenase family protein n=1 Tax=Caulobacter sp. S45 TaxID=1641861 RepID=UPI001577226C|nr:aldehyde dehydrogenase family protein [Caulobacter sp. S45]